MPAQLKALKGIDRQVFLYGAILVFAIAGTVATIWRLGTIRAGVEEQRDELATKELEADAIVLPTDDERGEWTTQENLMASMLLADPEVPAFFSEVTRLATLNRLDRFVLGNEERILDEIDEEQLSSSEALSRSVGIRRYIVVTLEFSGDYRNVAEFIDDIGRLPRLSEFVSIQLRRTQPNVAVTMSFHVYKNEVIG